MTHTITVQPSGLSFITEEGENLLDAALKAKVLLPFSCRTGSCSTCKAKVVSGHFEAGEAPTHILDSTELAEGYTLLCQVVAHSDMVIDAPQATQMSDIKLRKMPSRVLSIEPLSDDVIRLRVQLPKSEPFYFYAGQYLDFILKDGQRRSYSMANAPNDANIAELHLRHMPGGVFTDYVFGAQDGAKLKEREIIRVEAPLGSFFLREDTSKPIIFLASGTGFAPIKAIVEHMQQQGIQRSVHFYWGGRRPADLYLHQLAQEWAATIPDFQYIPVISEAVPEDQWQGRSGFVHQAVMADFPDLQQHAVYACGAPAMVEAARHDFVSMCHLPEEFFYADAFTSAADA